jgi:hypothetical protein
MAKKTKGSKSPIDQNLMDFVVDLIVDDAFRQRFDDPNNREQMMDDRRLSDEAKQAIRDHNGNTVERLLNTQIVVNHMAKKPAKKKTTKKKTKKAGKKR